MKRCQRAVAEVRGSGIRGTVSFCQTVDGTMVTADIRGLTDGFYAFHIHEGGDCGGVDFGDTGGHYNPTEEPHPFHAGDLPPLLFTGGGAYLSVLTRRFRVPDVIGKTVVIHSGPDDFRTQPSGNAGVKLACGVIRRT